MKIEYPHGTIYLNDCSEILPRLTKNSVEICVTSPPYNLNKNHSGGGASKTGKHFKQFYERFYEDNVNEYIYQGQQKALIHELQRICISSIYYNHRPRPAWHSRNKIQPASKIHHPWEWLREFPIWTEIIWNRLGFTNPKQTRFHCVDERIYQIGKPRKFKNPKNYTSIWNIPPTHEKEHVCSFPAEIPKRCIETTTEENDVVIDPYMGIGTTILTAVNMNRRFIGIERDETYFNVVKRRLDSYYNQIKIPFEDSTR
ncbi:MAG: hypothetical protein CMD97_05785 [Gammaproteobacteria bacterium]|nr:hypothetical protein [Gammaproteobacteria bacterium]